MTPDSFPAEATRLDRSARHTWALFVDWSRATGTAALPADPETVAEFLADHPAQLATHRRRVGAINAVHRRYGLAEPGRAAAVHAALANHRHQRMLAVAKVVGELIPHIPTTGWPRGLFGCRDALILTLVAGGLTYTEIAALRRGHVKQHDGTLVLVVDGDRPRSIMATSADPAYSPLAVHHRWARVQAAFDRFVNIGMLAEYLERGPVSPDSPAQAPSLSADAAEQPLIASIDRWGYTPLRPTPITAQSIASITRSHLAGQPSAHQARTSGRPPAIDASTPPAPDTSDEQSVLLDGYYDHGMLARRRAQAELAVVGEVLDDVTTRVERLLRQLARIVGQPT